MSVITGFAKTPDRVKMLHRERDNFSELLETSVERRGEKYKRSDRTPSKKTLDEDTATSIGKANIKLSQFLYHMANEPSIGLFHVNEHAKRSIPKIVSIKNTLKLKEEYIEQLSYDMDDILVVIQGYNRIESAKGGKMAMIRAIATIEAMFRGEPPRQSTGEKEPTFALDALVSDFRQTQNMEVNAQAQETTLDVIPEVITISTEPIVIDTAPEPTTVVIDVESDILAPMQPPLPTPEPVETTAPDTTSGKLIIEKTPVKRKKKKPVEAPLTPKAFE